MAITNTSSFVGTNADILFEQLILGAETIEAGLLDIFADKRNTVFLDRFNTPADSLIPRVATPSPSIDMVKDEKAIVQGQAMEYHEFDPLDFGFENFNYLWSQGSTVRAEAAAALQKAIMSTVAQRAAENLDKIIWQGDIDSLTPSLSIFDGFIKNFTADATVIDTVAAPVDASSVIGILEAVVAAMPANVQESSSPTIICDHATKYFYRSAARALDVKGSNIDGKIGDEFGGFPLVSVGGMPAGHIVMCNASTGQEGNLKAATWMVSDYSNVLIDRLQANSDLFFVKISFDFGVQAVFGSEIVMHKPA